MALINCPECGKEVSDKSKQCIHCGYPINNIESKKYNINVIAYPEYLDKNHKDYEHYESIKRTVVISEISRNLRYKMSSLLIENDYIENRFKEKGNNTGLRKFKGPPYTAFYNLSKECAEFVGDIIKNSKFDKKALQIEIVESDDISNQDDSLLQDEFEKYKLRKESLIKCPTCGSTNTQKISTTSKVVGAATFGLFSKTARSQFKCNHCGYKW